eukprot:7011439-Pyramimonas_sp.AAC.1
MVVGAWEGRVVEVAACGISTWALPPSRGVRGRGNPRKRKCSTWTWISTGCSTPVRSTAASKFS